MICAAFPSAPVLALTTTASYKDVSIIKESLNLKKPLEVIASPNRTNLFYKKDFGTHVTRPDQGLFSLPLQGREEEGPWERG